MDNLVVQRVKAHDLLVDLSRTPCDVLYNLFYSYYGRCNCAALYLRQYY
jgi:hypothetical protein